LARPTKSLEELPGVARVLRTDQLAESRDPIIRSAALSYHSARSGDLMVLPKEYWFMSPRSMADGTTHGRPYEYDTHVPVMFFGGGIKGGRSKVTVAPADISPSLAELAAVKLPSAEGHALSEAPSSAASEFRINTSYRP
jgi:hypothetical protein